MSERLSFTEGLELVQKDLLTSAYSIFELEPLQPFYLGISKLLKACTFTYVGPDAICSHPKKPGHERRALCSM